MTTVSTHILDLTAGRPAAGVPVGLDIWPGGIWVPGIPDGDPEHQW